MTVQPLPLSAEGPAASRLGVAAVFGVIGGPLAWFVQLLSGYALASGPCFPRDQRLLAPASGFAWTHTGILLLLILCAAVAFAAFLVSWRGLRRGLPHVAATAGRSRFLATWGMALGAGFCIATVLTAVGIALLPRCAG